MPAVTRIGDNSTVDPCGAPPRPAAEGSPNVYANSIPVVRLGDNYAPHACPGSSPHITPASAGSPTVFVNGKPVHRIGDSIACDSVAAEGSPDVFADDVGSNPTSFPVNISVILPVQYSMVATEAIRQVSRYAMLDDHDSPPIPASTPADTPPPTIAPKEEVVETKEERTEVAENCENITTPDYSFKLSQNTTLGMFSNQALFKHNIQAQAGLSVADIICNLKTLANNVYEQLIAKYPGARINSGFRTVTSGKSQHEKGMACDIQWSGISNAEYLERAKWIASNLTFDQMIFEHGNSIWIHLSYNRVSGSQRKNIMTMKGGSYEPGLKLYYA